MASIGNLRKRFSQHVWITPFAEVAEFPTYVDESGRRVQVSEEWREVGFKVLYPTLKVMNELRNNSVKVVVERGSKRSHREFDPERLADFLANRIILDWDNVTDEAGQKVTYDGGFMKEQFMASQFLLNEFVSCYHKVGESLAEEERREAEDFL